ncbi:luciferase family protein [Haladaptatus pallidirubidus]|uniref:Luciferase domain-containing protein n=1 Tax=Haladaptatus pallidirubidus TaxID=1008152 RepID=A0AAV3UQJ0_9EURY|nr:luciferase family protein [Haladaptatus pallidirubidus]
MGSAKSKKTIESTVSDWPGINVEPHDRGGGHEFTLNGREIGHIHNSRLVDIPFARRIHDILIEEERAQKHHVLPDSGWVSYYVQSDEAIDGALWLLCISYLYHLSVIQKRASDHFEGGEVDIDAELNELNLSDELRRVFSELRADT